MLPAGAPLPLLVALAAGIGLRVPPLGACVRSLLPSLAARPGAVRAVYAVEASAVEFTWIAGPPIVLGIGALLSTGAALAIAAASSCSPARSRSRPSPRATGGPAASRTAARRRPARAGDADARDRVVAVGVLVGAAEVAVAAAAAALGSSAAAGPLLGVWGLGSLAGGVLATRLGGGARGPAGLALVLAALAAGHLALAAAAGSLVALGARAVRRGRRDRPRLRERLRDGRPRRSGRCRDGGVRVAETAIAIGGAAGAALAGAVADGAGRRRRSRSPAAPGCVAVLVTLLRSHTLAERARPSASRLRHGIAPRRPERGSVPLDSRYCDVDGHE